MVHAASNLQWCCSLLLLTRVIARTHAVTQAKYLTSVIYSTGKIKLSWNSKKQNSSRATFLSSFYEKICSNGFLFTFFSLFVYNINSMNVFCKIPSYQINKSTIAQKQRVILVNSKVSCRRNIYFKYIYINMPQVQIRILNRTAE